MPCGVDVEKLKKASQQLKELLPTVRQETDLDALRGWEGVGANAYFRVLDDMILNRKETFSFQTRNRRPPLDPVNAMLSFAYSLLANDCASRWRQWGWTPMWVFSTATARDGLPWRWT